MLKLFLAQLRRTLLPCGEYIRIALSSKVHQNFEAQNLLTLKINTHTAILYNYTLLYITHGQLAFGSFSQGAPSPDL